MHYIYQSNSNVDEQYQLIGADATGYLVDLEKDGSYIPLDYTNKNYYELQSIFTTVATEEQTVANFAPEFTNIHDGIKCFAQYTQVKVVNEDGTEVDDFIQLRVRIYSFYTTDGNMTGCPCTIDVAEIII